MVTNPRNLSESLQEGDHMGPQGRDTR